MSLSSIDTEADIEKLFAEWNTPLFRYVYLRVEEKDAAEDITQQAFLSAWKYRHTYNSQKATLKNWLFAIAVNEIKHYYADKKKREADDLEFAEELTSPEDIEEDTDTLMVIEFILKQMQNLSQKEQKMLHLRYREGLQVQEISEQMNMELSATKVALHRALEKLRAICQ